MSIDLSTYNDALSATDKLSGSDAIQLTPESWILSALDQQKINSFNAELSSIRVVFEFELDEEANKKAVLHSSS